MFVPLMLVPRTLKPVLPAAAMTSSCAPGLLLLMPTLPLMEAESAESPPVIEAPPVDAVREPPLMLPVAEIEDAPLTAPVSALAVMVPPLGDNVPLICRALAFVPAATLAKFTEEAVTPVRPLP